MLFWLRQSVSLETGLHRPSFFPSLPAVMPVVSGPGTRGFSPLPLQESGATARNVTCHCSPGHHLKSLTSTHVILWEIFARYLILAGCYSHSSSFGSGWVINLPWAFQVCGLHRILKCMLGKDSGWSKPARDSPFTTWGKSQADCWMKR